MTTKKVFISIPMNGLEETDIRSEIDNVFKVICEEYAQFGIDCELIDSFITDKPDPDILQPRVWYLGNSIKKLSEADLAVFHPGWRNAPGCIIEHMVCALYDIPYVDISMPDVFEDEISDVVDNTHDWDVAGEVNAEMSKQVAEAEGLSNDDILEDDDVEDALGFEHDDVDDLIESDPDLNPYAQHSEIDIVDEFNDSDILEPGEYNADVR